MDVLDVAVVKAHQAAVADPNSGYDPNIHRPVLLRLTKKEPEVTVHRPLLAEAEKLWQNGNREDAITKWVSFFLYLERLKRLTPSVSAHVVLSLRPRCVNALESVQKACDSAGWMVDAVPFGSELTRWTECPCVSLHDRSRGLLSFFPAVQVRRSAGVAAAGWKHGAAHRGGG